MANAKSTSENSKDNANRFFDGFIKIFFAFFKILKEGLKTKCYKRLENYALTGSVVLWACVMIYQNKHFKLVDYLPYDMQLPAAKIISVIGDYRLMGLSTLSIIICSLLLAGFASYKLIQKYQKALDNINLKSGLGDNPKVVSVDKDSNRTRILVKSIGIGEERYKSKLDDFRASLGQQVESVNYLDKDNRFLEISLAHHLLASNVNYSEINSNAKKPYSFVVGQSLKNAVTENLEDVPHYLIAGSTGGGKSVAFKSMLLGLLETSKRIQLYIFDFKQVEMNEFAVLPNVKVIKNEHEASILLEGFVKEMDKRYQKLEEIGEKKINPDRDKLPRIVVGIDECSDLLGKVKKDHPNYKAMERAKRCLNELSRKARASGIHLIFATQKVDMNSIDTQIQENLEGRLSFRMNTIENSVRVLQNNKSYYLPSIPGRAIWKKGANYTEVQCPFISDDELKKRIEVLKDKFSKEKVTMLEPPKEKVEDEKADLYKDGGKHK
ncbi:MAG: DNA translocase FtsK [Bacteriovoracaceae bacterium]|nr:DNA translocase FtsK [Bacteriovoracaceae bacterium]